MQIFYINLDRDTDRRDYLEAQLARAGLSAERVSALTPGDLDPALIAMACDATRRPFVTPAELACLMSHRKAWGFVVARNLPFALILEDDAMLSPRVAEFAAEAPMLVRDADVLRVETDHPGLRVGPPLKRGTKIVQVHRLYGYDWGGAGYIVTRQGAEKLLGPLARYDLAVDSLLFDYHFGTARKLRRLQAVPAIVANGDAAEHLGGRMFESNLETARIGRYWRKRQGGRRRERPLDQNFIAVRNRLRRWANKTFRGIVEIDVPLL